MIDERGEIGMKFKVIDNKTGKEADPYEIALHEDWAKGLCYCDMEGFAITEDGSLVLMDECGHVVYCDTEWFKVVFEEERSHENWEYLKEHITEMCDADGELNQKQTCQFVLNLMSIIDKEGDEK